MSKNGSGGIYASITGSLESDKVQTVRISVDTKLIPFSNHSLWKLPMQVYWYHSCTGIDLGPMSETCKKVFDKVMTLDDEL